MQMTATKTTSLQRADEIELSVVLAANDRVNVADALRQYRPALDALDRSYEVLCAIEGTAEKTIAALNALAEDWPELEVLARRPWRGEDAELGTTIKRTSGKLILTLPPYFEIAPENLSALFEPIDECDMVVINRLDQPIGGVRQRFLKSAFRRFFGHAVSDVFSRVRLSRREVLEEVGGFGVRQHFIPIIAADRGYRVEEVEIDSQANPANPEASEKAGNAFVFRPFGHASAFLDAITLVVVLKFLRRPLRFFGAIGMPVFLIGLVATLALVIARLFFDMPLADRPALIFSVLMIVLGIQIVAIGLVGEIIIFANSRHMKQYKIATVIRRDPDSTTVEEVPHIDD